MAKQLSAAVTALQGSVDALAPLYDASEDPLSRYHGGGGDVNVPVSRISGDITDRSHAVSDAQEQVATGCGIDARVEEVEVWQRDAFLKRHIRAVVARGNGVIA